MLGGLFSAVVTVGGCLGGDSPSDATPTDEVTASPTTRPATGTTTDAPTTDCPPTLTVYEVGAEPVDTDKAVDYDNLTADQQATFERARTDSVEDFDDAWYEIPVVAYRGAYYRASVEVC